MNKTILIMFVFIIKLLGISSVVIGTGALIRRMLFIYGIVAVNHATIEIPFYFVPMGIFFIGFGIAIFSIKFEWK